MPRNRKRIGNMTKNKKRSERKKRRTKVKWVRFKISRSLQIRKRTLSSQSIEEITAFSSIQKNIQIFTPLTIMRLQASLFKLFKTRNLWKMKSVNLFRDFSMKMEQTLILEARRDKKGIFGWQLRTGKEKPECTMPKILPKLKRDVILTFQDLPNNLLKVILAQASY